MRPWLWAFLAIALSGALFQASLPPVGAAPLAWIAFVPTLYASKGRGFVLGFVSGLGSMMLAGALAARGLWCAPTLTDADPGWIYAGFAVFGVVNAAVHGIVGESRPDTTVWWTPLLWAAWAVLFEAATLVYLPVHWALTQGTHHPLLRIASVTGIWGVSLLGWAVNFGIATSTRRNSAIWATVAVVAAALGFLKFPPAPGKALAVAVQSSADDEDVLVRSLGPRDGVVPAIVVWPEASGILFVSGGDVSRLCSLASTPDAPNFATTYDDAQRPLPHNTMAVFSEGRILGSYRKRKLFGGERNTHTPGEEAASAGPFGLNVCFDSCFPAVMRETALVRGVNVILLPTLDPASPYGVTQAIHAAYTPFRSAELGVAIVRAEANAYSMVTDSNGAVLAMAGSGTEETVAARVGMTHGTVYKTLGDWLLVFCAVGAGSGVYGWWSRRPKSPRKEQ
ncbi:MAG: hypothetical protein JST30_14780 [Armatimonadetes bacterium]|nr:hypothetical protein [Armatimonadota bacterium]